MKKPASLITIYIAFIVDGTIIDKGKEGMNA